MYLDEKKFMDLRLEASDLKRQIMYIHTYGPDSDIIKFTNLSNITSWPTFHTEMHQKNNYDGIDIEKKVTYLTDYKTYNLIK